MSEALDRNKTDLTHRVTAVAAAYLKTRGFCLESEVPVREGWIADLAGFCYPTPTEIKNLQLKKIGEIISDAYDCELLYFKYGHFFTAVVEVKTSKSDFSGDKKFDGRIFPANLCYIAYPKGLIEDIPEGWMGLETSEDGERLLRLKWSSRISHFIHSIHQGNTIDFVAAIAKRIEYRTRFAQQRAWLKAYRAGKIILR